MSSSPLHSTAPDDTMEKKETLPLDPAVEGGDGTRREDALVLLSMIKTTDDAHPMHWVWYKKWFIVVVYCLLQVFVTLTSTTYVSVEFLIMEKWPSSQQVVTLGQSMFIVGTAVGPAFLGEKTPARWSWWRGTFVLLILLSL
jgi:hypothetical protein